MMNWGGYHERAIARSALEELVTSQGTKAVKLTDELALALEISSALLEPVLEKLVQARLFRTLERDDGRIAHELAHEYLISRDISLGVEAKERKEAEELITQEVENWRRFGTLLGADKLALIADVRQVLRLSPEAQELLFRSALQVGRDCGVFARKSDRSGKTDRCVDRGCAQPSDDSASRTQARLMGTVDRPEAVEPLLMLAIQDAESRRCASQRRKA